MVITKWIYIGIFLSLCCCNSNTKIQNKKEIQTDNYATDAEIEKYYTLQKKAFLVDSLEVMAKIKEKLFPTTTLKSYEYRITSGTIFRKDYNYLIIEKLKYEKTYYIYKKESLVKLFSYGLGGYDEIETDSIYDINIDNRLDVVVKQIYASSNIGYQMYIQNNEGQFNEPILVFNPLFNKQTKTVMGYANQNSPIVEYYNYQWNKETLDTLEFIGYNSAKTPIEEYIKYKGVFYYEQDTTGNYIINAPKNTYTLLKQLPKEYKTIDSLFHHQY